MTSSALATSSPTSSSAVAASSSKTSSSVASSSGSSSAASASLASITKSGTGGNISSKIWVIASGASKIGSGGPGLKLTADAVPGSTRVTEPRPQASETSRIPSRWTKVVVPSAVTCPSNSEPRTPNCAVGVLRTVWVPLSRPPKCPLA